MRLSSNSSRTLLRFACPTRLRSAGETASSCSFPARLSSTPGSLSQGPLSEESSAGTSPRRGATTGEPAAIASSAMPGPSTRPSGSAQISNKANRRTRTAGSNASEPTKCIRSSTPSRSASSSRAGRESPASPVMTNCHSGAVAGSARISGKRSGTRSPVMKVPIHISSRRLMRPGSRSRLAGAEKARVSIPPAISRTRARGWSQRSSAIASIVLSDTTSAAVRPSAKRRYQPRRRLCAASSHSTSSS